MKNLITYYCYFLYDILWGLIFIEWSIKSFNDQSIFTFVLFTTVLFLGLKDLIRKHYDFMKYYPYFENKWSGVIF